MSSWLQSPVGRHARVICAAGIACGLWAATRLADRSKVEASSDITRRFQFTRTTLADIPGPQPWHIRPYVHPSLRRVPVFVSGIGSGVAVNDLDGDGLANDVCLVESRTDQAIVAPAPGTGERYAPFALPFGDWFVRDRMAIMGCMPGDFNEDGLMDIFMAFAGRTPVFFLRREGSSLGPSAFKVQPLLERDEVWITGPVGAGDYDGDGHVDILVANYFKDGSDIYNAQGTGRVQMPHSQSRAFNGGGQRFYRWTGATSGPEPSVSFVQEKDALPRDLPKGWSLATASYDLDGDLLPEVYIAHDFGPDRLLHNESKPGQIRFRLVDGEQGFATPISKVLGHDSFKSMGVDFGDMNGDGLPDIFVSNMTTPRAGYESQEAFINTGDTTAFSRGKAPFVDRSESLGLARTGWAWEARLADFDNDGVLEAVQTTGFVRGTVNRWPELQELALSNDILSDNVEYAWPTMVDGDEVSGHQQNPFFVRQGASYVDIAKAIGFGEQYTSRGMALADTNGDGGLDIVVSNMWGPSTYYENRSPGRGQFLGLHIVRPAAGVGEGTAVAVRDGHPRAEDRLRPAVGTKVRAVRADGRVLLGHVDGGGGHTGKRSSDVLLGLGPQGGESDVTLHFRLPGGAVRTERLRLKPGWHTVILGVANEGGAL